MKKIVTLMAVLSSFAFSQTMFVNDIKTDLIDPKTKKIVGEIYEGTPVKVIKQDGDMTTVEIVGEVVNGEESMVALKKEPLLTFYKLKEGKAMPKARFMVNTKKLNSDAMTAWEEIELVYYDTCSSCHAAHKPKEHLMSEWEAYILAMQTFAKINDDEKDRILRFMQAFAKNGIIKE